MQSVQEQVNGVFVESVNEVPENHLNTKKNLESANPSIVSFQSELPIQLQLAMKSFIERYPNWDQYRLIQAALAGFLVQHGMDSRQLTRLYVGNMFSSKSLMKET